MGVGSEKVVQGYLGGAEKVFGFWEVRTGLDCIVFKAGRLNRLCAYHEGGLDGPTSVRSLDLHKEFVLGLA